MSSTGEASVERELSRLVSRAMASDFEMVAITVVGRKVLVQGTAPSYAAKALATQSLRQAGFTEVENGLRVVPGMPVLR